MAASELEICNRAAQKLGVTRISSINEETTNGRALKLAYFTRRDALMREHRWNFSIRRATLAADEAAPAWGRANAFTLPSDFLKLIPLYPEMNDPDKDWVIEEGKILTNDSAPLYIRYIARIEDVTKMDILFREALSEDMAYELEMDLGEGSNTRKEGFEAEKKKKILAAKRANAIEVVPADAPPSSWETAGG